MSIEDEVIYTIRKARDIASYCRDDIWAKAKEQNREPKIYLHWTAGGYNTVYDDYHINIKGDGQVFYSDEDLGVCRPATYRRNSGSVSITLCCCVGGTTKDLGCNPPTPIQIERMSQVVCGIAEGLWLTIDKQRVLTHGEAANNEDGFYACEPYAVWSDPAPADGDTRWDLEFLGTDESPSYKPFDTTGVRGGDVLRGKAEWYRDKYLPLID